MSSKRYSAAAVLVSIAAAVVLLYCSLAKPSSAQSLKHPEIVALDVDRIQSRDIEELFGNGWQMSSKLEFVDAYALKSGNPQFGGWSALSFDPQEKRFIAVSDTAHWMSFGRFAQEKGNPPVEKIAATIGPVLNPEGKPVAVDGARDIEALALAGNGIYLSYESPNSGLYYTESRKMESARFRRLYPFSSLFADLPKGYGIEALTVVSPPGKAPELLAIAERPTEGQSEREAWLIKPTSSPAEHRRLSLNDPEGYDVSDIAWSPSCGLFGLERKLTWYGRLKVRLVKLSISDDRTTINREALFSAHSGGKAIDNYEGLAVVDVAPGVCDIYALSDDNFLPIEKTILMRLRYKEAS